MFAFVSSFPCKNVSNSLLFRVRLFLHLRGRTDAFDDDDDDDSVSSKKSFSCENVSLALFRLFLQLMGPTLESDNGDEVANDDDDPVSSVECSLAGNTEVGERIFCCRAEKEKRDLEKT